MLTIDPISLLSDNYAYLLVDKQRDLTAIVDPSEAAPVIRLLESRGKGLDYILNTHHHWDHTGGNLALKEHFKSTVVGYEEDAERIPGLDHPVNENSPFLFGKIKVEIIPIPGHTLGHIAFYLPAEGAAFVGDTLFSIGCGKVFEGTAAQMWTSLQKLMELPPETRLYCGHEYTEKNIEFALSLEPSSKKLLLYQSEIQELRAQGLSSMPTTLEREKRLNPFLRAEDPKLLAALDKKPGDPISIFAEIRALKDRF